MPLYEFEGRSPRVHETAWIAPTAVVIGDVEIGPESSVWYGTVVRSDFGPIRIGRGSNIQDNCVLHGGDDPSTFIGDDVTVGHGCIVHSARIESGALIGNGASVLDGAVVGEGAVVAAGSVVTPGSSVRAGRLAVGRPATDDRSLDGHPAADAAKRAPQEYRELRERHRAANA